MKLIKNPNSWSCMLAAAAMVLDTDCKTLIQEIGHDGSKIIFPELLEPAKRQGFHHQEIIDYAIKRGYAVTPIEVLPYGTPDGFNDFLIDFKINHWERLYNYLSVTKGIITGIGEKWYHAVAWDGENIYDPSGEIYSFDRCALNIDTYLRFDKIISLA